MTHVFRLRAESVPPALCRKALGRKDGSSACSVEGGVGPAEVSSRRRGGTSVDPDSSLSGSQADSTRPRRGKSTPGLRRQRRVTSRLTVPIARAAENHCLRGPDPAGRVTSQLTAPIPRAAENHGLRGPDPAGPVTRRARRPSSPRRRPGRTTAARRIPAPSAPSSSRCPPARRRAAARSSTRGGRARFRPTGS